MGPFRRYRDTILVVLLLAVPFFVLRANIRSPEDVNVIDRTILRITAPVEYIFSALARGVSNLVGEYVYLVDVKSDNNKLAHENARLRNKVAELSSAQIENRRYRRLLGLRESIRSETVSAVVIGKDTTDFFRIAHLTLDNPAPGIRANMPVVSLDGVVGTVQRVSGEKIDVKLAVESGFGVDIVVERTGARGFARGAGSVSQYAIRVEYMQRTDEVDVGDMLITSGFGCRFPKGLTVAKVTKVIKRDFGVYQEVVAEPTVDFSRLEEALIVLSDNRDCEPAESASEKP